MSTLSPSQRLILATARDRAEGTVLPLPDGLARRGRTMMLKSLIARGLIAARPAHEGEAVGSGADEAQELALEITPEGRAVIEAERPAPSPRQGRRRKPAARQQAETRAEPAPIRPGTKQALLLALLRRPEGASIAEIQEATGWQPHTARAALTGLKHKGFTLMSAQRENGTRAYREASGETEGAQEQAH